ncbi:MAG: GHKL domain-containing protein [Hominimerdicola sp.]
MNVDWYNLILSDKVYNLVAKLIINLTFGFALYLVYKFCNYRISLNSFSEYIFYVILPIITFGIIFLSFIIATDGKTSHSAMISLGVISVAMVFVSVLVMSLMLKAAYSNRVESQNYIMKKQQEQYRERIIEANKSLEEIAVIRHDMKNKILCIGELLKNENYNEAIQICSEVKYQLEKATVLFNTDNPYLNSILNITYKKAKENNIDIKITVTCSFQGIGSTDIVALVGNVCDNAIEYLSSIEGERKLELKLFKKGSYYFISAKNNIVESVLHKNPKLKSTKNDKVFHGLGIKNIRTIAKKYQGSVDISEIDSSFLINIMLEIPMKH